ncbi:hypothetical protein PGT21_025193 [Puccinia graminis f. sp. tritici]|uniref:Uncharacterized protein n=1 Tax=Puccinia graminis f. sp. tritici TaxID=56615 RepID=A0A5B0S1T6_PUCGR|nr:hypothetical protein PGT21_025193 [Puccinia graminis f. sp. tritici]KAA1131728.1 hypothetical protein PGTUg99_017847 [Puccinia graminis f. sp. tritici]
MVERAKITWSKPRPRTPSSSSVTKESNSNTKLRKSTADSNDYSLPLLEMTREGARRVSSSAAEPEETSSLRVPMNNHHQEKPDSVAIRHLSITHEHP